MHQPHLIYITRKRHSHILPEKPAEILPAQIKTGCNIFQHDLFPVMRFYIRSYLRQTLQYRVIVHQSRGICGNRKVINQLKKHLHGHSLTLQTVSGWPGHIQWRQTFQKAADLQIFVQFFFF